MRRRGEPHGLMILDVEDGLIVGVDVFIDHRAAGPIRAPGPG